MRVFIGMVLGACLTIAGAFTYDALSGRIDNMPDASASEQRPMVNWNVVIRNWHLLETDMREMGARVQEEWRKLTG